MEATGSEGYDVVIGLEVHVQVNTVSKIFSGDATAYGCPPNSNISVISLGHPGTLPVLNKEAVAKALKMGLACESEISRLQVFDRKNYFYPDLPKGYQITQDRTPMCKGGFVQLYTRSINAKIPLEKIHLEEDAGKSVHVAAEGETQLDFNRAGVPLIEIVTKPAIRTAEEAAAFVTEIRKMVRYLEISDGNMEEGSLRCDANVSIKPRGAATLGRKVEIKNLNSVRNLSHAITYDVERQIGMAMKGESIASETRMYDAASGKTYAMRTKEELNDYRYFPDPDLSPLQISEEWLEEIRLAMPPLPHSLFRKFTELLKLSPADALVIAETKEKAFYFEQVCQHTAHTKAAANWMIGPVQSHVNDTGVSMDKFPVRPEKLAQVIELVEQGNVSFSIAAQRILPVLLSNPHANPETVAREMNLLQGHDVDTLQQVVNDVIKEFPLKVEAYKNGKTGIVSMFMGEIMKRTQGKADPRMASELISQKLMEK